MNRHELSKKVVLIANQELAKKQYVSAIDILLGLGHF